MTAEIITVLAVVAGIVWLGIMVIAAFRNRSGEDVPPNLRPGIDDQQLETRRLESGQKAAIAFSAFLAVALPLYFLSEPSRQAGFVDEFAEASIARGETLVAPVVGFDCFSCHGPLGSGGVASYVEKRSGVTVSWSAPRLDDIFYRYSEDEVAFWITYGRGNTPMPPWGLAGGGPMNEHQVEDIVNYLKTIQRRPQQEVVNETPRLVAIELARLSEADAAVEAALVSQRQIIAEIDQAPEDFAFIGPVAQRAREILDGAGSGFDTDGDGLPDVVEAELSALSAQAVAYFRAFEPIRLDPEEPDAELVDEALARLGTASTRDPILVPYIASIEEILGNVEGEDTDGDGIPDPVETSINAQLAEAAAVTISGGLSVVSLDPANPESVAGVLDLRTATRLVGALESVAISKRVLDENEERIRPTEEAGLEFLSQALRDRRWEIDLPGVAAAMGVSQDEAARAVGLFNANCARCHTAGFSAGVAFTQEVGSGGFGPALWDGRPVIQFGEAPDDETRPDLLVDFLINGSEAQRPYGLNGFGTGRMPGFGPILSRADIELLARYLRSGNLGGVE